MSVLIMDRAAAKQRRPNRKAIVLDVLRHSGPDGMTADEIEAKMVADGLVDDAAPNFARPRLTELKDDGKIFVVGRRPGRSGHNVAVWRAKP